MGSRCAESTAAVERRVKPTYYYGPGESEAPAELLTRASSS